MGLGIAVKAFMAALTDNRKADEIQRVLSGESAAAESGESANKKLTAPAPSSRDSSISLLAVLQRESRLIDLVQEDLGQYSDAQVGAAARPCLQKCAAAIERMFELRPLIDAADGESIEVQANSSPTRYQWIGERGLVTDSETLNAKLVHHGWLATRVELPQWSGPASDNCVVAPVQVQSE